MAVGADEGVGEDGGASVLLVAGEDALGEVLEVDLVDDAGGRGDDAEVGERLLAPLEEAVALVVALELLLSVDGEGDAGGEIVHLDGVVNDEVAGYRGIDQGRVAAEALHGVAHGGEVDDAGDAGEVLEDDAPGHERHLDGIDLRGVVARQAGDVVLRDDEAVHVAEDGFEEDSDGIRHPFDACEARSLEGAEVVPDELAGGGAERAAGVERAAGHRRVSGVSCVFLSH